MKQQQCKLTLGRSLIAMVCFLFSLQSGADCWEITETNGHVQTASDIWQIKNRLDGRSTLMGQLDGKSERVLIEEIQSIQFMHRDAGWLGALREADTDIVISFIDGRSANLMSRLNFFLLINDEPEQVEPVSLQSINRCKAVSASTEPLSSPGTGIRDEVITPLLDIPSTVRVHLKNGDILDGIFLTEEVIWKTEYALFSVKRQQIKSMRLVEGPDKTWVMILKIGSKVTGQWIDDSINIDLAFGDAISVDSSLIRQIDFIDRQ